MVYAILLAFVPLIVWSSETCIVYSGQLAVGDVIEGHRVTEILTDRIAYVEEITEDVTPEEQINRTARIISRAKDTIITLEQATPPSVEPNDSGFKSQWGLHNVGQTIRGRSDTFTAFKDVDINANLAWHLETGRAETIVAVIDTGVNHRHRDLKENMWRNEKEYAGRSGVDDDGNGVVDDIYGYNPHLKSGHIQDDHGHGTAVAGVIGARGDNRSGMTGVNWDVQLMPIRVTNSRHESKPSIVVRGVVYAVRHGAKVINYSMGSYAGPNACFVEAIDYAKRANVMFVTSAGNRGYDNDVIGHYPSNYENENLLAVAAMTYKGKLKSDSNYGMTSVDLAAPGSQVYTTRRSSYTFIHGTSFASPHVAGVAALLYSHFPGITYQEVRRRILENIRPLDTLQGKVAAEGMLDAYGALVDHSSPPIIPPKLVLLSEDQVVESPHEYPPNFSKTYVIEQSGAERMRVKFDRLELGRGDQLRVLDSRGKLIHSWTGEARSFWTSWVQGAKVQLELKSDRRREGYGFRTSVVEFEKYMQ